MQRVVARFGGGKAGIVRKDHAEVLDQAYRYCICPEQPGSKGANMHNRRRCPLEG